MSISLQSALKSYSAGKYRHCLALLAPLLKKSDVATEVLLLAAQCYTKSEQFPEASVFYKRAAERDVVKRDMFRLLSIGMLVRANLHEEALGEAREVARSGGFSVEAEKVYRRALQTSLALDEYARENQNFLRRLLIGEREAFAVESPFEHISWCADEAINARITCIHGGRAFSAGSQALRRQRPHTFSDKIRIGYLSNDVSDQHATMRLFQGALLQHDREKFDITLFCHTTQKIIGTDLGMRKSYGRIVPIGHLNDEEAAKLIRSHKIDILVDLKGHTKGTRIDLINLGLAPIQVSYLGFPGSGTGIDCDYIVSDRIVTPDSSIPYYHEKLCRLPESYQSNDDTHRALPPSSTRAEAGLPEDAIVFASFNAVRKITPQTAALWMRLLHAVDNSILWLMCEDRFARRNFLHYAATQGIAEDRIVFAESIPYPDHVARLQTADLGLDTFPYNGHTTTSDKLWAGLPVVTMRGTHFASRVSESLLNALHVPELVADNETAYVELCISLVTDRARLDAIREKIAANRHVAPLFDTERFTRHLETGFAMMVAREKAGLDPDHIDVPCLPPRHTSFGTTLSEAAE